MPEQRDADEQHRVITGRVLSGIQLLSDKEVRLIEFLARQTQANPRGFTIDHRAIMEEFGLASLEEAEQFERETLAKLGGIVITSARVRTRTDSSS